MPYSRLFYHFVWTTKDRQPFITEANHAPILKTIAAKVVQLKGICHAVNAVRDHVHLVATVPPSMALGIFIWQVKGNSSHLASRLSGDAALQAFEWQSEYGVMTISESHLTSIVHYVLNQQEHHTEGDLNARLERWED
jgi:putative transposase